ncbi:helicase [Bifidobacterium leontopitheci]|uniref:Helicase n=1 Tax=Bifidobacterium leontopitheci TaxID=2650774 RepID=A0A6I1GRH0_9BIFI|nr:helicase [Bifidobacterium leontopitheci]KAB7790738.1 helicase [Bifidobacterium leontopitheci]
MVEEANNNADQPQDAGEPHGEPQSTDWEAKYRETVSHSREWEKRAKDNKAAADELQQLKESQMSEAQKAEARTARLQKELDALKAEKQTAEWRAQVAEESQLPASLIVGDSLEAMQAHAKAVNEYVASKTGRRLPGMPNAASQPAAAGSSGDWLRDQFLRNH